MSSAPARRQSEIPNWRVGRKAERHPVFGYGLRCNQSAVVPDSHSVLVFSSKILENLVRWLFIDLNSRYRKPGPGFRESFASRNTWATNAEWQPEEEEEYYPREWEWMFLDESHQNDLKAKIKNDSLRRSRERRRGESNPSDRVTSRVIFHMWIAKESGECNEEVDQLLPPPFGTWDADSNAGPENRAKSSRLERHQLLPPWSFLADRALAQDVES
ncbi:hypothetical protein B0H11DRAFT_1926023 [Mycena galericulata]|nr:hypothetical protein B0H11DRAFT_1926023 [Mycena galericulata]